MKINSKQLLGFSLIELLVAVTVMMILLSGALAFFLDYLDKRAVNNSVDEIKTYFQRALSDAKSGSLGGCDQLNGYRVTSAQAANIVTVTLQADCTVGTPNPAVTFDLAPNVSVTPNLNMIFKVLNAGVELPGGVASQDITVANDNNVYVFTIYREGRFSSGSWQ
ncbi:MAG: hypothetical protein IT416_02485 [Candidatus Pacebacteria bacterium]|nr:hypothetical protein [Candidatus Paceibacterota bacterium]